MPSSLSWPRRDGCRACGWAGTGAGRLARIRLWRVWAARGRRGRSVLRAPGKWPGRVRVPSCVTPTKLQVSGRLFPGVAAALWAPRPHALTRVCAGASAHSTACSRSASRGWTRSASERYGTPRTPASSERTQEAAPARGCRLCFSRHRATTSWRSLWRRSPRRRPPWGSPTLLAPQRHPASALRLGATGAGASASGAPQRAGARTALPPSGPAGRSRCAGRPPAHTGPSGQR